MVERSFTLLDDQPYTADSDPLGFEEMAEALARLILASRSSTPFTLGIEAGWGLGKSTLMHRLERTLATEPTVTTVWFNGWTAEEGTALEGLIKSVLDRLDPNILRRAARNKRLISWLRVASLVVAEWLRLGRVVDTVWKEVAIDPRARNEMRDLMERAMKEWTAGPRRVPVNRTLVVFIDDLDRCPPVNVLQIFEAVKLYLNASGLIFVIGYDPAVVSDAILDLKQYSDSITSHHYVEKIVQIVYRIPSVGDGEAQELMNIYLEQSGTSELFDDSTRSMAIEQNARNPRRIKRFINGFTLEYGLDAEWSEMGPETLIRVLIIDLYFPEFGRLLRSRSARDPVHDFQEFVKARDALRREVAAESEEWVHVERVFESYGRPIPPTHAEAIQQLEEEAPEGFPKLAQNQDLLPLLEGLGDREARKRLSEKLRRYSPVSLAQPSQDGLIFISYRRADSAGHAARLYDALSEHFGANRVAMDIDVIDPGRDFAETVESTLASATVVLVVIGREWLVSSDADGRRSLDDPGDWLRLELGAALAAPGKRVIPILVQGAEMPRFDALPNELEPLARRNAYELSDARWHSDVKRLIDSIEYLSVTSPEESIVRSASKAAPVQTMSAR